MNPQKEKLQTNIGALRNKKLGHELI